MSAPLAGQVAVVTGAGRGIGREAALALAQLGASIVVAELNEGGPETAASILDAGGEASFVPVDVADETQLQRLHDEVLARYGRADIFINNAVTFCVKPLLEHSRAEWDRVMSVNLRAAFLAAKLFLPGMLERHRGVFVTMESGEGMPYMAAYFASKAALRSLALSLASEIGPDAGVSVFCFGAGMVDTPAIREAVPKLAPLYGLSEAEFIAQSAPGGRLMPATDCGRGLAGCVLHAERFHGQETAAVAGLSILDGDPPGAGAAAAIPPPSDDASGLAGVVAELRREVDGLGRFQRQWYRRTLKQATGESLEDWETIAQRVGEPELSPAQARAYAEEVERLARYFTKLEADARGFIREPGALEQALTALERRRTTAEKMAQLLRRA